MPLALGNIPDVIGITNNQRTMEIKITIAQEGKQAISREFTNPQDALDYLESITPVDDGAPEAPAVESVGDDLSAPGTGGAGEDTAFTNDQRFNVGDHVVFHQHVGEYAGEHVIEEERAQEIGFSYRTDRSGDTFIHAHWFAPVEDVVA